MCKDETSKFIAKMQLNQLYGIFGRKQELIKTINVKNEDLINYITTRIVKNIIKINDDISTILISNNINVDILKQLNSHFSDKICNFHSYENEVKSNVAIAAAVTSYAGIEMIKYKINYNIFYTDTDSVFTSDDLPGFELGNELGLIKDELKGNVVNEAYFLGIKQYGYCYYDKNDCEKRIEKSVFAGVTRIP
jgi:DNA polymerase type B, organellar and viral